MLILLDFTDQDELNRFKKDFGGIAPPSVPFLNALFVLVIM